MVHSINQAHAILADTPSVPGDPLTPCEKKAYQEIIGYMEAYEKQLRVLRYDVIGERPARQDVG
jgi:hypothetical protein